MVERPADVVLDAAVQWIAGLAVGDRDRNGRGSPGSRGCTSTIRTTPTIRPSHFAAASPTTAYAGEIAFADARLGDALEELSRRGLLANTLVVVTADHGESLGEHQERTHGLFAYDATLRVPLIVWAPPAISPASSADRRSSWT